MKYSEGEVTFDAAEKRAFTQTLDNLKCWLALGGTEAKQAIGAMSDIAWAFGGQQPEDDDEKQSAAAGGKVAAADPGGG